MAKKGGINAERAKVWREKTALEKKPVAGLDDRAMRPTIIDYIVPQKQAAKRHYGSHQYFTKRAWNVVQSYIKQFTNEGDVVCDPYGGSGVTVIEALALGRRGIYVDISRWAAFLAEQIAATPVDLSALQTAFEHVEQACGSKISRWAKLPETLIQQIPLTRWYPKNYKLPRNADVSTVDELFTHRQLLSLSELFYHICAIKDDSARNLLKYAFSATLYMCNRTFISAKGRKESRGGSSIFSIFRYKVSKQPIEFDVFGIFKKRVASLVAAKKETNKVIGQWEGGSENAIFLYGYAQNLTEYVKPESVDYIFTDPPYGAHIAYLDLTKMWDAWLGFEVTDQDMQEETIEDGDARHTAQHFKTKLTEGIGQMFRVLKYDRWMSIVFAHREPAMWDTIVKAAEAAGFEYVNTVAQPLNVVWSMHKKKNPLTVLSGELILNFRKIRNPRTIAITSIGCDAFSLIKDSAELSIVAKSGATTDQIYIDLIPKLLENGLLGEVSSKIGDITPLLNGEFDYDGSNKTWHVRPGKKLGYHIPLDQRIKFYTTDFLNQQSRLGNRSTVDDIVFALLPKLKNGIQPQKQRVITEIKKIAAPVEGKYWALQTNTQREFELLVSEGVHNGEGVSLTRPEDKYEHNEILLILAKLGQNAGFRVHIGKKEQASIWNGEKLSKWVDGDLNFMRGAEKFTRGKIEQIDLLWLDGGKPAFAFEIEHSTAITTGIDRFIELLKIEREAAEKVVIVAPKSRRRKMNEVLSGSHYIGAPMYMESKVRYLWYSEVIQLAKMFSERRSQKSDLMEALMPLLHTPEIVRL